MEFVVHFTGDEGQVARVSEKPFFIMDCTGSLVWEQMERAEHSLRLQVFLALRWSLSLTFLCGSYCFGLSQQTRGEYQHFWTVFVPISKMDNTVKGRQRMSWRGSSGTSVYKAGYGKALFTAKILQSE